MTDVHDLPEVSSADRMHELDRACWCFPSIIESESDGDTVIAHVATTDSARGDDRLFARGGICAPALTQPRRVVFCRLPFWRRWWRPFSWDAGGRLVGHVTPAPTSIRELLPFETAPRGGISFSSPRSVPTPRVTRGVRRRR